MSSTRIPSGPTISRRTTALAETRDGLSTGAGQQLQQAGTAATATVVDATAAAIQTGSAASAVVHAGVEVGASLVHGAEGALLATASAIARVAEEVGDLLGRSLQMLGRALISFGNLLRKLAGGPQVVVRDLEQGDAGPALSARLQGQSAAAFDRASAALGKSLAHLVDAQGDLKGAGHSLLAAAEGLAATAAHLGAAGALGATAVAVEAARVAVDACERGLDGAGALLQGAGKAVVAAGNAVNTAAGTDTGVHER